MSRKQFQPPKAKNKYPSKCAICGGPISETLVTLAFPDGRQGVKIVNQVPAGVCSSCGEEYLTADVGEKLELLLDSPPHDQVKSPVWKFVANL